MFSKPLYIQVRENQFIVRNIKDDYAVQQSADPGFSHPRSLVGDFTGAAKLLKSLVAYTRGRGFVLRTPVVIHPLEKIEGGLTQVEERLFSELAICAGATKAIVWIGEPLSDSEVLARLK